MSGMGEINSDLGIQVLEEIRDEIVCIPLRMFLEELVTNAKQSQNKPFSEEVDVKAEILTSQLIDIQNTITKSNLRDFHLSALKEDGIASHKTHPGLHGGKTKRHNGILHEKLNNKVASEEERLLSKAEIRMLDILLQYSRLMENILHEHTETPIGVHSKIDRIQYVYNDRKPNADSKSSGYSGIGEGGAIAVDGGSSDNKHAKDDLNTDDVLGILGNMQKEMTALIMKLDRCVSLNNEELKYPSCLNLSLNADNDYTLNENNPKEISEIVNGDVKPVSVTITASDTECTCSCWEWFRNCLR